MSIYGIYILDFRKLCLEYNCNIICTIIHSDIFNDSGHFIHKINFSWYQQNCFYFHNGNRIHILSHGIKEFC